MQTINRKKAIELINNSKGQFYTVEFLKKDNSLRKMNCRQGVKKHLKGGQLSFPANQYGFIVTYDTVNKGYRMINVNTLQTLKINKQTYKVA